MKAYCISENNEPTMEVVFAETAGKAKYIASTHCDTFIYTDFINLRARREPALDKYYKEGKLMMDWCNSEDRIVLVKECGFSCVNEIITLENCNECSAKEYCDSYHDLYEEYE